MESKLRLIKEMHGIDKKGFEFVYRTPKIIIKAEDILRAHVLLRKEDK